VGGGGGRRWEEGHIEEWSQISFPDGVLGWAQSEFRRVKDKQASLLGVKEKIGDALTAAPLAALPPVSKL